VYIKSALIISAASLFLTAIPASAQSYGSGNSYGNSAPAPRTSTTTDTKRKTRNDARIKGNERAQKKLLEAQEQLRKSENARLARQNSNVAAQDGVVIAKETDIIPADKAYGSGKTYEQKQNYSSGSTYGKAIGKPDNCPAGTRAQEDGTCMLTSESRPVN